MRSFHTQSFALGLGLFAVCLSTTPAAATTEMRQTLEEMVVTADVVAEVTVREARVARDGKKIFTYTRVDVIEGWKGAKSGDVLEISQLGGDLDGKSQWIVGAHHYKKGEHLVFFGNVSQRDPTKVIPLGVGTGLFEVKEDLTGLKVVELIGDVALVEQGPDGKPRNAAATPRHYDSLDGFKQTVLRLLVNPELPRLPTKQKLGPQIVPTAPKSSRTE